MKLRLTPAQRRSLDGLLEKGLISAAIGGVLLLAPTILRGSSLVTAVTTALLPVGWSILGLGGFMVLVHTLMRKRIHAAPEEVEEVLVSRFQNSVLPDDLLNPPRRIRLQSLDTQPVTRSTVRQPATRWNSKVFSQIEWRRFEAVCVTMIMQAGFRTETRSNGPENGVDAWLYSRHAQGPVALAHCRHWLNKPVDIDAMRNFHQLMQDHKLARGTYTTSGRYTEDARNYAKAHGINALDGQALLEVIRKRTEEEQDLLLSIAYAGEYWCPTCANCGIKMMERVRAHDHEPIWGCVNYPRCDSTLPMNPRAA